MRFFGAPVAIADGAGRRRLSRSRPGALGPLTRLFLALLALLLAAAEAGAPPEPAKTVAILVTADLDVYDDAVKGFEDVLQHRIVARYDMRGDFDRGRRLIEEIRTEVRPDAVLAVGVWALQVAVEASLDVPVIYAMVLNPPNVVGELPGNVTGASMNVPVAETFRVLKEIDPSIRRVGAIYQPANTGYLVASAQGLAPAQGLEVVAREVSSSGDAVAALDALQQQGIDALWILPDETVLAPAVVEHMLLVSYRQNLPLLGLSRRQAEMGALATLAFASARDIGRQSGELANEALAGRQLAQLPFTMAREVDLTVNLKTARKIGVVVPNAVLADAQDVIQ